MKPLAILLTCHLALVTVHATAQQTYAVVVGVADYEYLSADRGDLRYADDDARAMYQFLRSSAGGQVPASHIITLINGQATQANILQALRIFEQARPADRVIFHFSGHGDAGMFLPYDAPYKKLLHADLKAAFKRSSAHTKIIWADACLSGSMKNKTVARPPESNLFRQFSDPSLNVVVMTSSRSNQTSAETGGLQQGVFTYFLVKGAEGEADLNHDHVVTVTEHYQYVRQHVRALTHGRQTPIIYGKFSTDLPITVLR